MPDHRGAWRGRSPDRPAVVGASSARDCLAVEAVPLRIIIQPRIAPFIPSIAKTVRHRIPRDVLNEPRKRFGRPQVPIPETPLPHRACYACLADGPSGPLLEPVYELQQVATLFPHLRNQVQVFGHQRAGDQPHSVVCRVEPQRLGNPAGDVAGKQNRTLGLRADHNCDRLKGNSVFRWIKPVRMSAAVSVVRTQQGLPLFVAVRREADRQTPTAGRSGDRPLRADSARRHPHSAGASPRSSSATIGIAFA
jgi:hypothetical protein